MLYLMSQAGEPTCVGSLCKETSHIWNGKAWETWLRRLLWVASLDGIVLGFCDSINSILLMHKLLMILAPFGGNNVGLGIWES